MKTGGEFDGEDGACPIEANGGKATTVELSCAVCDDKIVRRLSSLQYHQPENPVCSLECSGKLAADRMTGDDNPRWSGGDSRGRKYKSPWPSVRDAVRERDDGMCQVCGNCREDTGKMHAHHIIPVNEFEREEDAHYEENAILLCPSCHPKVEHGVLSIPTEVARDKNLEQPND